MKAVEIFSGIGLHETVREKSISDFRKIAYFFFIIIKRGEKKKKSI
jgi:hypothetical protein